MFFLKKIFGPRLEIKPSIEVNIKNGLGEIKFHDGRAVGVKAFCTEKIEHPWNSPQLKDEFILSSKKGEEVAKFLIYRPLYSGKPIYQGLSRLVPLIENIKDFMPISYDSIKEIDFIGEKLVKVLEDLVKNV